MIVSKRNLAAAVLSVLILAAACDGNGGGGGAGGVADDDGSTGHGCTVIRSSYWTGFYTVYHNNPTACPQNVAPHTMVQAGGVVIETSGTNALTSDIYIYSTNAQCSEQVFGTPLAHEMTSFHWADFRSVGASNWGVEQYPYYEAGTGGDPNSDCPVFQLSVENQLENPTVVTRVHYVVNDMRPAK